MSCHSAIFGWASEHLESDSRNLAGMFFTQLCTSVLHFPNVDSKYLLYFPPLLNQQEVVLTLHSHSVTSEAKTLRRKNSLPNRSRPRSRSLPLQQQLAVSTSENAKSRRRPSVRHKTKYPGVLSQLRQKHDNYKNIHTDCYPTYM